MKTSNFLKVFASLVLISIVSTATSFYLTGDASALFAPIAISLFAIGFVNGLFGFRVNSTGKLYDGFVINDTTYAGEAASQFIVKALTGADTVAGGHVYIKDGIKKKFTIPRWDANYEDFIQDRAAMPVSKGSMTVDGQALNPADYMIFTTFNPRDFEAQWYATQLNPTLIDRALPYSVESVVVQEVLKRHAKYFNKALWNNSTSSPISPIYKYWDGYLQKAANAGDTIVVSTPTTLTADNIQAEFLRGYNDIKEELRYDPDMKYFCSYNTYDLYDQSQIAQTYKGVDITQVGKDTFKGKKVVKIADFPDNYYFIARGKATPESNLWVGLNSIADEGLQLGKLRPEGELFYIKMLMKADVQIGWNSETVLYGTGAFSPEE